MSTETLDPIEQALEDGNLELFERLLNEHGKQVSDSDRARFEARRAKRESEVLEEYERIMSRGKGLGIDGKLLLGHWDASNPTPKLHNLTRERLRLFSDAVQPLFEAAHERLGKLKTAFAKTEEPEPKKSEPVADSVASEIVAEESASANASVIGSEEGVSPGPDGEVQEWLQNEPAEYREFLAMLSEDERMEQIRTDFEASKTSVTTTDAVSTAEATAVTTLPAETAGAASESTGETSSEKHECKNLLLIAETAQGDELVRCMDCGAESVIKKQVQDEEEHYAEEFKLIRAQMVAEGLIPEHSEAVHQFRISDDDSARWYVRKMREHQNAVEDLMKQFQSLLVTHLSFMNAVRFRFDGQLREHVWPIVKASGKKSKKYPEGTVFFRKVGGWAVKSEFKTREYFEKQIDAEGLLRENIDASFIEEYGIKLKVEFSKTKVKQAAAAGMVIPGVEFELEREDGKMGVGIGRAAWSFEKAKRNFSKQVKLLEVKGDSSEDEEGDE